jgi:hypothetical protein
MAAVLFHSAEAWLIMASICGRLLLLGAVQMRFIWVFLDVLVSMTPGGVLACRFSPLLSSFLFQHASSLATAILLVPIRRGVCCRRTLLLGDVDTSPVTTIRADIFVGHVLHFRANFDTMGDLKAPTFLSRADGGPSCRVWARSCVCLSLPLPTLHGVI